jgi:hypothetical protein
MPLSVHRCGADMMVHDNSGKTAEDIILTEKPDGWQEMLHWWNKFKPGIMVLNTTLSNISVISWWSSLLVEETGVHTNVHRFKGRSSPSLLNLFFSITNIYYNILLR